MRPFCNFSNSIWNRHFISKCGFEMYIFVHHKTSLSSVGEPSAHLCTTCAQFCHVILWSLSKIVFYSKLSKLTSSLFDCFDWCWLTILSLPATWFIQIESQKILQFDLWHTFTSSYFFDFHICILSLSHLPISISHFKTFTFTFSYFCLSAYKCWI